MMRIFLIALLFLAGCKKSEPVHKEQIVRINISTDPQTLDPRMARDLTSVTLMSMFFEGLTRVAKNGDLEMAIAERIAISEDGLQYRFFLRNSFWSNGDPVTAFDFAKSWRTVLDPKFPADMAYQLYGIKNAKKAKMGEVDLSEVGIRAPDSQTLIVELEQPMPYFLKLLTMPAFFAAPYKLVETDYICNGPFKLASWKHGDEILAKKNPLYWQADDVQLSEIHLLMMSGDTEIQMFEEGKLDWAGSPLSTIPVDAVCALKGKDEFCISPFLATSFFRVNIADTVKGKNNPLSSLPLRKALALAIDRGAIVEHVLQGGQTPAFGLVPTEMGLSQNGYFQGDKVKARELIADLVLEEPIKISFASSERNAAIMQAVQKQWENVLGIQVELEAIEPKIYFQRVSNKEFQLAAGSWTADFNDPINFLEVFKYNAASTNNTNWEKQEYIDLLDQSALCSNDRIELLRKAETLLMEEMPIIPIFHFAINNLKRKELEDVALSSLGKIDFRWAHIQSAH